MEKQYGTILSWNKWRLGIGTDDAGNLTAHPMIPESWSYFKISGVMHQGQKYTIIYDREGTRYGYGKGIHVMRFNT